MMFENKKINFIAYLTFIFVKSDEYSNFTPKYLFWGSLPRGDGNGYHYDLSKLYIIPKFKK